MIFPREKLDTLKTSMLALARFQALNELILTYGIFQGMDVAARRLLFQIGTVGFCLNLVELVEIREQVSELIDYSQAGPQLSVVGTLPFQQTLIPVVDLARRLGMLSVSPDIVLVLNSPTGNLGLLVGHVEGFYSSAEMTDCPVPHLLQTEGWRCFDRIALHLGVPYLQLNLSECYSGANG